MLLTIIEFVLSFPQIMLEDDLIYQLNFELLT